MKLSIVIPVYNVELYLAECLDSVLAQTLRDIEVVCVDDGSTDGSGRILDEYASRDPRVRVFHQDNSGVGPARNRGIDEARGEFIAFMDPDDLYPDPDVLYDLWRGAVDNGVGACGGGFMEFLPNGATRTLFKPEETGMSFPKRGVVSYGDWQFEHGFYRFVYSRSIFSDASIRFPPYIRYQDPPFMIRALAATGQFYALPRPVYSYRLGTAGIDWKSNCACRFKALCAGLRNVAEFAKDRRYDLLLARQRDRIFRDFRAPFLDRHLRNAAKRDIAVIIRLLGLKSFEEGRRQWDADHDLPREPEYTLRQRFWRWRHPEVVRAEEDAREAERRRKEYAGDVDNFGRAYADGMAQLRYGGKVNA